MVGREFLSELEKTTGVFRWTYDGENRIRGFLKSETTPSPFDPIAALAFVASGQAFAEGDPNRAGNTIGLSESETQAIVDAANDRLWKHVDGQLVLDGYSEWLRDSIALALGLDAHDTDMVDIDSTAANGEFAAHARPPARKPRQVA